MSNDSQLFAEIYKSFEDKFRGSRELIANRLSVYLPLIESILNVSNSGAKALDIGSGRGEWLEFLAKNGWECIGVDSNPSMAEAARELGIQTEENDALLYLRNTPDASFNLVSAFHVVEHVETEYLLQVLREIYRVLAPGGVIILETPNPENLSVGTWTFYLDPTHKTPLPPPLLQFFVEKSGFSDVAAIRLNGTDAALDAGQLEFILSTVFRSGRDYAVLGRKRDANSNEPGSVKAFAETFNAVGPAGVNIFLERARELDTRLSHSASAAGGACEALDVVMNELNEIRDKLSNQGDDLDEVRDKLSDQGNGFEKMIQNTLTQNDRILEQQFQIDSLSAQLQLIHGSRSWKALTLLRLYIFSPLRNLLGRIPR